MKLLYDAVVVNESSFSQIELKQFLIYCDPYMAEMENCCELLDPKVKMILSHCNTNTFVYC